MKGPRGPPPLLDIVKSREDRRASALRCRMNDPVLVPLCDDLRKVVFAIPGNRAAGRSPLQPPLGMGSFARFRKV